jgi:multidrug resistance protein, MATE family
MLSRKYLYHSRRTLNLAYPIVFAQLGHMLVGVVDSIMVGQAGAIYLASAALANTIFTLALVFGLGLTFAITPLVAAAEAKKDVVESSVILKNGLLLFTSIGVILSILLYFLSPVFHFMGQPEDVVIQAIPYFQLLVLSLIPLLIYQVFKQFIDGLSLTKPGMYITLASNFLNIVLNYILIFGHLGFEPMGLVGAGWATVISRIFAALAIGIYFFSSRNFSAFHLEHKIAKYSYQRFRQLFNFGFPIGMQLVFEVSAFSMAAIVIGWIGAPALAAHQIALSMAAITYMMASGISAASTIRIGNFFGATNFKALRDAGTASFIIVVLFMLSAATIFIVGRHVLPTFFVDEAEVISIASSLLIFAALFQVSDGVQVNCLGILRGMNDVKIPTLITFIAYWLVGLPSGYILGIVLGLGAEGVWIGLFLGLTAAAVLLLNRFYSLSSRFLKQENSAA